MINLLPPQEKKILILEEKKRLIIILGSLILISLICLVLILFSIKINLQGQLEAQKITLSFSEKEFQKPEIQNLKKEINLTNKNFSKLNSFYQNQINFTEILEQISGILPEQVYLTNLSINYRSEKDQEWQINSSLSGFAKTRDILFEFKSNLEAEDFKEIYFPLSNLIEKTDINFNLSFKIK